MSAIGRPKKETTPDELAQWKIAGRRLSAWRKDRGLTQETLAEKLNKAQVTIGRYERGAQGVPESVAKRMELETGIFWRYWTGETNVRSLQEFRLAEEAQREADEAAAAEAYGKECAKHQGRLEALFFLCGYRYSIDPAADFYDFSPNLDPLNPPPGRHTITPYSAQNESYSFTDGELDALLKDFEALVSLHWHRKVLAHRRGLEK